MLGETVELNVLVLRFMKRKTLRALPIVAFRQWSKFGGKYGRTPRYFDKKTLSQNFTSGTTHWLGYKSGFTSHIQPDD